MRLFFLGTAAAEGYPAVFCNCARCAEARSLGGRNIRLRSAVLINDDLLIDFGPDLLASAQRFGRSLGQVTTALVTHAHSDHFALSNIHFRAPAFTGGAPLPVMRMFGPREVAAALPSAPDELEKHRLEVQPARAFERWQRGGYRIEAYRAHHAVDSLETLFYSVDDGRRALLYASDTGAFPADTWQALAGKSFDVIVMEETMGEGVYDQHMAFDTFLETAARLRAQGHLRPGGRLIATHMSHSGNPTHEKVEAVLNPHGVEVAYDGLEIVLD